MTDLEKENAAKPREFWIKESFRGHKTGTCYPETVSTKPFAGLIHVIEYRAIESLTKQLEEFKRIYDIQTAAIEKHADELRRQQIKFGNEQISEVDRLQRQLEALRVENEKAREVIRRIADFNPSYTYTFENARSMASEFLTTNQDAKKIDEGGT